MPGLRIPGATYRLQLRPGFGFAAARDLVAYLDRLGITDLYTSPIFAARQSSEHGYDVTDPNRLNPQLGDEADFAGLTAALQRHGMGLLLDIVPNHMAASPENPWWADVLEFGPDSPHAAAFDIDWHSPTGAAGRMVLPILGAPFGTVLENRELRLEYGEGGLALRYHDTRLPVAVPSYRHLLAGLADPPTPAESGSRRDRAESIKHRLWRLYATNGDVRAGVDANLRRLNGRRGHPRSFDALEQLLGEQWYRLAHWRLAPTAINYRRFFDISDLVGVRQQDPDTFRRTHDLALQLVRTGQVTGLRVDHIDGLYDPLAYLQNLQAGAAGSPSCYVVVEKILAADEDLPADWPVAGTTGYDLLNLVNGLFVDPHGMDVLDALYQRLTAIDIPFTELEYRHKRRALAQLFPGELHTMALRLQALARWDRHGQDIALPDLESALAAFTASLPVYRTYSRGPVASVADQVALTAAATATRRRHPDLPTAAAAFVHRATALDLPPTLGPEQRALWLQWVQRWQQFTGPVTAKGVEDTALYVYNRLISLNTVGGNPAAGGIAPAEFHRRAAARGSRWPHSLNATSTHDSKRSEDVRARINVLSELPEAWAERLQRWMHWNAPKKRRPKVPEGTGTPAGDPAPDRNEELLLYQTLVGAWPLRPAAESGFRRRLRDYLVKALREAKVHSGWLQPNEPYEAAVIAFAADILTPGENNRFLDDFRRFQAQVAGYGAWNALAQVLLKIAAPGVPDFYQGTEFWNFSLVDPDNRRPVDFDRRRHLLDDVVARAHRGRAALARELLASWTDGRIKLYLTHCALTWRREHPELFRQGEYLPLATTGPHRDHLVAFARRWQGTWLLVAVPRLCSQITVGAHPPLGATVWGQTGLVLPNGAPPRWTNVLTDEVIRVTDRRERPKLWAHQLLGILPVAMLTASAP